MFLLLTCLTRSLLQTLLRLRQKGAFHFICISFFRSPSEKKKYKKRKKHRFYS